MRKIQWKITGSDWWMVLILMLSVFQHGLAYLNILPLTLFNWTDVAIITWLGIMNLRLERCEE